MAAEAKNIVISHIVAAAKNDVIGVNNQLPWHIPEDLQFFREKTRGHIVIMGRKTFESLGKPLPNRLNIVITRQKDYFPPGAVIAPSLEQALQLARGEIDKWDPEVFILGGAEIYRASLNLVDLVYLTRIHKDYSGDAKYPALPAGEFEEIERRDRVGYSFLTLRRIAPAPLHAHP